MILSGSDVVDAGLWKNYGGSIFVAQLKSSITGINQLLTDGQLLPIAQYPAYQPNYTQNQWIAITANSSTKNLLTSSNLAALPPAAVADIAGAGIHIRTTTYSIEDQIVSSYNSSINQITLSGNTTYALAQDYGFYLDNKLWMLTQPGAQPGWFYDGLTNKLYLWLPGGANPISHKIEIAYRNRGSGNGTITIQPGVNFIRINHITIDGSASNSISILGSSGTRISDCTLTNSAGNGISVGGVSSDLLITQNTMSGFVNNGVYFANIQGGVHSGATISNNTINNVGTVGPPRNSYGVIYMPSTSTGAMISGNKISNGGYHGIVFGNSASVEENVLADMYQILSDGGAIYSWGGGELNSTIKNNMISGTGMYGNQLNPQTNFGIPKSRNGLPTAAIYLDNTTIKVNMLNNSIFNNERGLYLHDGHSNQVTGNKLFGNVVAQIHIMEDSSSQLVYDLNISNNVMVSMQPNSFILINSFVNSSFSQVKNLSGNRYAGILSSMPWDPPIIASYSNTAGSVQYTLPQLQSLGQESSSTVGPAFDPFLVSSTLGSNLIANSTFDSNTTNWGTYTSPSGTMALSFASQCFSSSLGGCASYTVKSTSTVYQVRSDLFDMTLGTSYLAQFDHMLLTNASLAADPAAVVQLGGSPYTSLGLSLAFHPVYNKWNTFKKIFQATGSTSTQVAGGGARLMLVGSGTNDPDLTYLIDNVIVQPVAVTSADPTQMIFLLTNPTSSTASIDCPTAPTVVSPSICNQLTDTDGNSVQFPMTLQPYDSKPVFSTGSSFCHVSP